MNKNIEPIKLEISKEYKELQERLKIDLDNKRFFTLKEVDKMLKKHNFKWIQIEPCEWYPNEFVVDHKNDSRNVIMRYVAQRVEFYVYKKKVVKKKDVMMDLLY